MKNTLKIGTAYMIDNQPMVLTSITHGRYSFTDGRYGFGRSLGRRASDAKILENLQVANVNPQKILDKLKAEADAACMASISNR